MPLFTAVDSLGYAVAASGSRASSPPRISSASYVSATPPRWTPSAASSRAPRPLRMRPPPSAHASPRLRPRPLRYGPAWSISGSATGLHKRISN
uniref:Uncharacterized protein n=1 Tax=Arundo donax TaxID=35708 RepID=A0A0A9AXD2_ARUDO